MEKNNTTLKEINHFDWEKFKEYVNTYKPELYKHSTNQPEIILKDMLYGLGIAIDKSFEMNDGYKRFIDELKKANLY